MRIFISFLLIVTFAGCGGANQYKIEKTSTITFKEAYYNYYTAGVKGGGSGFNIFLIQNENSNNIELKGIYFQGKYAELKFQGDNKYQSYIKGDYNWQEDVIVGEKKKEEKIETIEETFPFKLSENEAVVSFFHYGKLKYNKIHLIKKELETLPQ